MVTVNCLVGSGNNKIGAVVRKFLSSLKDFSSKFSYLYDWSLWSRAVRGEAIAENPLTNFL